VVNSAAGRKKAGTIALVIDERLTRDRRGFLSRVVTAMRHFSNVQIIEGEITQEQLIQKLEAQPFSLVLAPWYRYLEWSKVEAYFGLTRSAGPTFAGYICDPIEPHQLGPQADHLRSILLDFCQTHPNEAASLVESLFQDTQRTGIRPLLEPTATIYCENWYGGQGLGLRIDNILALPEIAKSEWLARAPALRIVVNALWSLVYEEGPGKSELSQAINGAKTPLAYFQVGCDGTTLALRFCYSMPGWTAKDTLAAFWPDATRPTAAAQLLLKYADFLRVHTIADSSDLEIVVGFFHSAPAEKAHTKLHSLWVEPISPRLVTEVPFEAPGPDVRHLKALPANPMDSRLRSAGGGGEAGDESIKAKERFIFESAVKIRELKRLLGERDDLIRDLRSGGVGTSNPLPPPDAESLLEAFQERYFETRYQIRQFELQIMDMENKGATQQEVEALRLKMNALANREQVWIRKLASTLESYRAAKQGSGG
jgi:hypothetical protein